MDLATEQKLLQRYKAKQASAFRTLVWRNRMIGVLRWAVPGLGILVAGFLIFQIILSNIASDFGISGLRVDKNQVIIDQPRYGGVMSDGTSYNILAEVARVQVSDSDIVNLEGATISIAQTDGYKMDASAENASLNMVEQQVDVAGVLKTIDSNNVIGEMSDVIIDWQTQILTASAGVWFQFEDGAKIQAQSLVYNAKTGQWNFAGVIYTTPGDGGL